jgi:hypothetical protein
MENREPKSMAAKVHFNIPEELTPYFSDVSFASHTDLDFRLSFYATIVPAFGVGQSQTFVEQDGERFPVAQARCVAQIVLTPDHARRLLDALQSNYAAFIEARAGNNKGGE